MIVSTLRPLLAFCALGWASVALAAEPPVLKSPSPNGRYALRIGPPIKEDERRGQAEIVEKATGTLVLDLGDTYLGRLKETFLVWSADSRWVAYASRDPKEGATSVYVWNGSAFEAVTLPENLPEPDIQFRKADEGGGKNYGGAAKPLRWRKPGELEMASDQVMVAHASGRTYTGTVKFTLSIDAQRKVTVRNVGKTKTTVN